TLNIIYYDTSTSYIQQPTVFSFKLEANGIVTASNFGIYVVEDDAPNFDLIYDATIHTSGLSSSILPITSLLPDIKITDFFSGILKMFNLT
ncbi:hypothetical protein Q6294_30160, partial [Klebsiella pneumoniae]